MSDTALTVAGAIATAVLAALVAIVGHLYSRLHKLEHRNLQLDRRIDEMWDQRRKDGLLIRLLEDHIDILEHHIWTGVGPPPPQRRQPDS